MIWFIWFIWLVGKRVGPGFVGLCRFFCRLNQTTSKINQTNQTQYLGYFAVMCMGSISVGGPHVDLS